MADLQGKSVLVTGAGRRVGAAIARTLGAAGMRVAVHFHGSQKGALSTCAAIDAAGGEGQAFQADLSDFDQAEALVDRVLEAFGGLDMVVASAANFESRAFGSIDRAAAYRALDLNLLAPLALCQRAAPALREARGNIVLITCTSRLSPYRGYLPYEVSKAGAHQLMRVLALELAPDVRVNAVAPGTVMLPDEMDPDALAAEVGRIPLGHTGSGQDVADAVRYLAGADFVTGSELTVDGGRTAS